MSSQLPLAGACFFFGGHPLGGAKKKVDGSSTQCDDRRWHQRKPFPPSLTDPTRPEVIKVERWRESPSRSSVAFALGRKRDPFRRPKHWLIVEKNRARVRMVLAASQSVIFRSTGRVFGFGCEWGSSHSFRIARKVAGCLWVKRF
jgi:hypothetical protein